jgi:orotidine-5'-phosphate decarboxylase
MPGIGSQGGETGRAIKAGLGENNQGLIVNSSRGIIFASKGEDFASAARSKVTDLNEEISKFRQKK